MKNRPFKGILALMAITALTLLSCERDDICVEGTQTTPLLVIEFFDADIANTTGEDVQKASADLWVEAVNPNTTDINGVTVIVDPIQTSPQAVNTLSIPLRVSDDVTEYRFIKNYELDEDGNQLGNEDIVRFAYSREEIFLSRACGYSTNFTLNDSDGAVLIPDADTWISNSPAIEISEKKIQNETLTHVKIYH